MTTFAKKVPWLLVYQGCSNRGPQKRRQSPAEMYPLTVLEGRVWNQGVIKAKLLLRVLGKDLFQASLLASAGSLACGDVTFSLHVMFSLCACLCPNSLLLKTSGTGLGVHTIALNSYLNWFHLQWICFQIVTFWELCLGLQHMNSGGRGHSSIHYKH